MYTALRQRTGRILRLRGADQVAFLGRSTEINRLVDDFLKVRVTAAPHLTIVSGEAGMGKSRLAYEFLERLKRTDLPLGLIEARGDDLSNPPPYAAIAGAIRILAGMETKDDPEEARRKIRDLVYARIETEPSEKDMHVQLLGNLVGVAFAERPEEMHYLLQQPAKLRERTEESLLALLGSMSRTNPLLLILEDLHWIDAASQQFVRMAMEKLQDRPIHILGLTRPGRPNRIQETQDAKAIRHIDLTSLAEPLLVEMSQKILGDGLTPEIEAFLVAQSEGNPFLLQEMARAILEGWTVTPDERGGWVLQSPSGVPVPLGIQSFLQARIDLLPQDQRELLRRAAVIGQEFSADGAAYALGKEPAEISELLDGLVERKFLHVIGRGQYQFSHALLQQNAYDQTPASGRKTAHEEWAWYLESNRSEDLDAAAPLIAHHFEKANRRTEASSYAFRAAEAAAKNGHYESSGVFFQKAFDLLDKDAPGKRYRVLLGWNAMLSQSAQWKAEDKIFELSEALLPHLPELDRAGHFYRRGRSLNRRGELDRAEQDLAEALGMAERLEGSDLIKIGSLIEMGFNRVQRGRYRDGREHYREAAALARSISARRDLGRTLLGIQQVESKMGHAAPALFAAREAANIFGEIGKDHLRAIALSAEGYVLSTLGDYAEAERILRDAEALSKKFGHRGQGMESLYNSLGRVLDLQGRTAEAINILERNLRKNPEHLYVVFTHAYLAQAYLRGGRVSEAREQAEAGLAIAKKRQSREWEAIAAAVLAQTFLTLENPAQALEFSRLAVERFRELGGVEAFDLEILLTHAKTLAALGRAEEARPFLLGTESLKGARALLEERALDFEDEDARRRFLEGVEVHREIARVAAEL